MAQTSKLYFRVGLLVLVGIALLTAFVLFLTANRVRDNSLHFETYIRESVQGLDDGAAVRYRGVAVGRVTGIGLVSAEYGASQNGEFTSPYQLVLVRFALDPTKIGAVPNIDRALHLGLRVKLASQGITGVSYLELDFVSPERYPVMELPWTPHTAYIPAIPSTVAQVASAAESLMQQLQEADLPGLINNVSGVITDIRRETAADGNLARTLSQATLLLASLRSTVDNSDLPSAVAELRGAAAEARQLLGAPEAKQAMTNAAAAMADLRTTISRLPRTLNSLEAGLRGARGTTSDVQAELAPLLRDLRATVNNLRDTTELLRRYPSQAIFGAPPPAEPSR